MLPEFRRICASIEEDVTVTPRDSAPVKKQEKTSTVQDKKADILAIAVGAVMFVAGEVIEHLYPASLISTVLFIAAYVILGLGIVWTAVKNLAKGHVCLLYTSRCV